MREAALTLRENSRDRNEGVQLFFSGLSASVVTYLRQMKGRKGETTGAEVLFLRGLRRGREKSRVAFRFCW